MKFSTVVLLAAGASAQSVSISQGLASILSKSVSAADVVVKSYTGGVDGAKSIAFGNGDLAQAVDLVASVERLPSPITDLSGALTAAVSLQSFATAYRSLASDLVNKAPLVPNSSLRGLVSSNIGAEISAVVKLRNSVTAQLQSFATGARPIYVSSVFAPITSALSVAQAAYA